MLRPLPANLPRAIYTAAAYSLSMTSSYCQDILMSRICIFTQATGHCVSCFSCKIRGVPLSFGVLNIYLVEYVDGLFGYFMQPVCL
jgi:hypothetical protein